MGETHLSTTAHILRIGHSSAFLDESLPLRREPRAPKRQRPAKFWQQFEDRALFYDCFWSEDGNAIILLSPPPRNLLDHYRTAQVLAQPSGTPVKLSLHPARSTMVSVVTDAPQGTESLVFTIGGQRHVIDVQPNHCDALAGRRLLFTMNKDNDPQWIEAWVRWHVTMHGTDAVVIFDNGSTLYEPQVLEERIGAIEGVKTVCVVSWPYRYGPHDPGVVFHRYWANFLQVSSYTMLFRRLARRCEAVLNCDIDELIGNDGGPGAYERAVDSPDGIVTCKGTWVECVTDPAETDQPNHFAYRYRDKNPLKAICANKWALDPSRAWCDDLDVMPSVHRIYGISKSKGRAAPKLPFWHFKAINTNWKTNRRRADNFDPSRHRRLFDLDGEIAQYLERSKTIGRKG